MATTIDIRKAQPQLTELLRLTSAGDEVLIVEGEKPLARLIPAVPSPGERIAGLNSGDLWMSDDFDEPLPDDFWLGRG